MRLPLIILSLMLVQACNSTAPQQRTSASTNQKIVDTSAATPATKNKSGRKSLSTVDVTGKTELVMSPMVLEPEFKRKQNRVWIHITPLRANDKIYLEPGEYRFTFAAKNSESVLRTSLVLPPATARAYLHVEVSPDLKHVYGWASLVDLSDAGFQDEKLKHYCMSANHTYFATEPTFPDYALPACQELASRQHPVAIQQLGYFYQHGIGVDTDYNKAIALYKQAIDLDNWSAGHSLLFLYKEQESITESIKLLQAMAKQGDAFAKSILAEEYVMGSNIPADPERAKQLAEEGFAAGFPSNALLLSHLQLNKIKGLPSFVEARALLNIYKKQISEPSMLYYDLENRLERVIKPGDAPAIAARQQQLEAGLNRDNIGSVCIVGLEKNPEYQNRALHYQMNEDIKKYPANPGQAVRFDHLPLLPNLKHQLKIYAGDQLVSNPQLEFHEQDGADLCFSYDSDEQMDSFKVNPTADRCDCKI